MEVRQRKKNTDNDALKQPETSQQPSQNPSNKHASFSIISIAALLAAFIATVLSVSFVTTKSLTFGQDPHKLLALLPSGVADRLKAFHSVKPGKISASGDNGSDLKPNAKPKKGKKKKKLLTFTTEELRQYDGTDPSKPIYLAIKGKVYDVTAGKKYYGKGGGYAFFAGVDAARSYITGCFETHLTHDLRGLSEAEIESLSQWTDFYEKHDTYQYVGQVIHDPIPDDAPIPEPCKGGA